MTMSTRQFSLPLVSTDSISSLHYHPTLPHTLLATSWDGGAYVYRYDAETRTLDDDDDDASSSSATCIYNSRQTSTSETAEAEATFPLLASCWDQSVNRSNMFYTERYGGDHQHALQSHDITRQQAGDDASHTIDSSNDNSDDHHNDSIKCLLYNPHVGCIISGSWDRSIGMWDSRVSLDHMVHRVSDLPGKVYTMSQQEQDQHHHHNTLVVGMQHRYVHIYDIRYMSKPTNEQQLEEKKVAAMKLLQRRESSLLYMTRCIACYSYQSIDGRHFDGYVLGSVEGRVAVEYVDPSDSVQQLKYAFKCHRMKQQQQDGNVVETLYPINAIAVLKPRVVGSGTVLFATGGSDGMVNMWDMVHKKRVAQIFKSSHGAGGSIMCLSVNNTATHMAIGVDYHHIDNEGEGSENKSLSSNNSEVIIRELTESEVTPKHIQAQQ